MKELVIKTSILDAQMEDLASVGHMPSIRMNVGFSLTMPFLMISM